MYKAHVTEVSGTNTIVVTLSEGPSEGRTYRVSYTSGMTGNLPEVGIGDTVIVTMTKDQSGKEIVYLSDYYRGDILVILAFLFVVIVIAVSRLKGIRSLVVLAFTFIILSRFIIPQILTGNNPVIIALLGALFIIPASFYGSHGFSRKTTTALAGTLITLCITGVLSHLFVTYGKITGFADEDAIFLQAKGAPVDTQSMLLAGIIIGAMGILDDVTIAQSAVVEKLHAAHKNIGFGDLYRSAMDVGRDHIASLVNTLILVYAGAALPLFLLFYSSPLPYSLVLNQERIATEIIRTLVSSIGIICAVPITTFIAVYAYKKN